MAIHWITYLLLMNVVNSLPLYSPSYGRLPSIVVQDEIVQTEIAYEDLTLAAKIEFDDVNAEEYTVMNCDGAEVFDLEYEQEEVKLNIAKRRVGVRPRPFRPAKGGFKFGNLFRSKKSSSKSNSNQKVKPETNNGVAVNPSNAQAAPVSADNSVAAVKNDGSVTPKVNSNENTVPNKGKNGGSLKDGLTTVADGVASGVATDLVRAGINDDPQADPSTIGPGIAIIGSGPDGNIDSTNVSNDVNDEFSANRADSANDANSADGVSEDGRNGEKGFAKGGAIKKPASPSKKITDEDDID